MKNRRILSIALTGILYACSPETDRILEVEYTIDKVVCQANSNYFVADGVSRLGLEVLLYTKQSVYTDAEGEERPVYMQIPKARWRNHTVKFFDRSGKEYPFDFTSTSLTPGVMEFYAEVDGIRSSKPVLQLLAEHPKNAGDVAMAEEPEPVFFKMNVRAADPIPALKRFPVIFHIIDTDVARDRMQELKSDVPHYIIDLYNNAFGRKTSTASNGANPNIEFVPALRDPNGRLLPEPGIHRAYVTEAENSKILFSVIFGNDEWYWDYDKYLNIWILSSSLGPATMQSSYERLLPYVYREGIYDPDKLPLPPAYPVLSKDEAALAEWKELPEYLENVGIFFKKNEVAVHGPDYVLLMSAFLGVIPNSSVNETGNHFGSPRRWIDDRCDDTFVYNPYFADSGKGGIEGTNFGNSRTKYTATPNGTYNKATPGYPWIIYKSVNTGEQSSSHSVITQDQARRIEWTVNHAEARQSWRNSYAIDPVP